MSDTSPTPFAPEYSPPAFVVGVTGHMNLDAKETRRLSKRVRAFFLALFDGEENLNDPKKELNDPKENQPPPFFPIDTCKGLKNTPVIVLTSLAPGADTLVATVALALKKKGRNITVKAPLPFPAKSYHRATSFQKKALDPNTKDPFSPSPRAQFRLNRLLQRIEADHTWHVELPEDKGREPLDRKFLAELELQAIGNPGEDGLTKKMRHRRYAVSGEYIANYCNILLTFWDRDSEKRPGGSCETAVGKLEGFVPGLLPKSNGFTWTQTGAVLHFPTRRISEKPLETGAPDEHKLAENRLFPSDLNSLAGLPEPVETPEETEKRMDLNNERTGAPIERKFTENWLFPNDLKPLVGLPEPVEKPEKTEKRVTLEGERREYYQQKIIDGAICLQDFNERTDPITAKEPLFENPRKQLDAEAGEARAKLSLRLSPTEELFTLDYFPEHARKALHLLGQIRRRAANATSVLSKRTYNIALVLFWSTIISASALHCWAHTASHISWVAISILLTSFIATLLGLKMFHHYKKEGHEPRDHDWRVLAEGLRVQFFLAAAGTDASVAAGYMQRHRAELDWIRKAISSVAAPYHLWRTWFDHIRPSAGSLDTKEEAQIQVIRAIKQNWLGEQQTYFKGRSLLNEFKNHLWHEIAAIFTAAGLILAGFTEIIRQGAFSDLHEAWPFVGLLWLSAFACAGFSEWYKCDGKTVTRKLLEKENGLWRSFQFFMDWLYPSASHGERSPRLESKDTRIRYFIRGTIGTLLAFSVGCITEILHHLERAAPAIHETQTFHELNHYSVIAVGLLILLGAVSFAWPEKNLYSEHARQYHTMATLFEAANYRMDRLLLILEKDKSNPVAFPEALSKVRQLLVAVGKEALDENAEWLILHRARPLEPLHE